MSDPVTNAEVEDVLSSIRRLVSEDKRPVQAQKAAPANDRLVLTPALRVAEVHDDEADLDEVHEKILHDNDAASDGVKDETLFDDPAHDYAADPYNFADDDDVDGDSDAVATSGAAVGDDDDADNEDVHDVAEVDDIAIADENSDTTEPSTPASLSAKIAALESAMGNIADTWEPDTPGSDEYSGTQAPTMKWEDDIDRDATGAPFDDDDLSEENQEDQVSTFADKAATPMRDVEPKPQVNAAASEDTTDHGADNDDAFAFGGDDQLIDEEALRDMVSDIVRSELQGALGERITRNVRKLVRREIHRALTAQELE